MKRQQSHTRELTEKRRSKQDFCARLLSAIALVPGKPIPVKETFQECLRVVCDATGWSVAHAHIFAQSDLFAERIPADIWHVMSGCGPELRKAIESKQLSLPTAWQVATGETAQPFVIPEVAQNRSAAGNALATFGIRSALGTPILFANRLKAVCEFFSSTAIDSRILWEEFLVSVSAAIANAIERSWFEQAVREMRKKLLNIQDDERKRISRELHDTTGQNVAMIIINLESIWSSTERLDPATRQKLAECRELAQTSLQELRTLSYVLHPPLLDELGVIAALRTFAEGFSNRSGIHVDLDLPERFVRLPRELEITIFRVVQESLANVFKHSRSSTAQVHVEFDVGKVAIEVRDEGTGLPLSATGTLPRDIGVGIASMLERVKQCGGHLEFFNRQKGTQVQAVLPIPAMARAAGA